MPFYTSAIAQKMGMPYGEVDWHIIPGLGGLYAKQNSFGDYKASRVSISANEMAVLVKYKGNGCGVILLDNTLKIKWNVPVTGTPTVIGKFRDNLLVISLEGKPDAENFIGTLIDPRTGRVIITKNISDNLNNLQGRYYFSFLFIPANKDFKIVAQQYAGKGRKDKDPLEKIKVVTISEELTVVTSNDLPVGNITMPVEECAANKNGEICILYTLENNITVQKFDGLTYKLIGQQNFSIDKRKNSEVHTKLLGGMENADKAYVALGYENKDKDNTLDVYMIDFAANKILFSSVPVNKEYKRTMKENYVQGKDMLKPSTDDWNNLAIVDMQEYKNELVVYKEVLTELIDRGGVSYITTDGIVEIYNAAMKPVMQQIIPKYMIVVVPYGISSSLHIQNDKLCIVSAKGGELSPYRGVYTQIDLTSNKLADFEILDKTKGEIADSKATLWFDDGFTVMYLLTGTGIIPTNDPRTNPQKFTYY